MEDMDGLIKERKPEKVKIDLIPPRSLQQVPKDFFGVIKTMYFYSSLTRLKM